MATRRKQPDEQSVLFDSDARLTKVVDMHGLPSDVESERTVLGAILTSYDTLVKVVPVLKPEDFHLSKHQTIYRAASELYEAGKKVDYTSVAQQIKKDGNLEKCDGLSYIVSLDGQLASVIGVESSVTAVLDTSARRKIVRRGHQIIEAALNNKFSPEEILEMGQQALGDIGSAFADNDIDQYSPASIIGDNPDEYFYRDMSKALWTPWPELNKVTGPWLPGMMIIGAARPGIGKTVAGLNTAIFNAMRGKNVVVFSHEMPKQSLMDRILASVSEVDSLLIKSGRAYTGRESKAKLNEAIRKVMASRIMLVDNAGKTLPSLHSLLRRINAKRKIDLIVIDYIGLMSGSGRSENRVQEMGAISRGIKRMLLDFGIVGYVLAQLNRTSAKDKRVPELEDLRETGDLEQDADKVIMHDMPEMRAKNDAEKMAVAGKLDMYVRKNRDGSLGRAELFLQKPFNKIIDPVKLEEIDRSVVSPDFGENLDAQRQLDIAA